MLTISFLTKLVAMHCMISFKSLKISKLIQFSKYQGLGNDFILIDNTRFSTPLLTPEEGSKLCDRNFGIGGDGVIFAMPGINGCDYTMRIYNSDGSEPQMCGNGIRCLAKYIAAEIEKKDINQEISYNIWTNAGKIIPRFNKGTPHNQLKRYADAIQPLSNFGANAIHTYITITFLMC